MSFKLPFPSEAKFKWLCLMLWKVFLMLLNRTKDILKVYLSFFNINFCSNSFYVRLYLSSIRMRLKNYESFSLWHLYKFHVNSQQVFSAKSQKSIKIVITCPEIIVIIDFYWQTIITNQSTVTACINKYS